MEHRKKFAIDFSPEQIDLAMEIVSWEQDAGESFYDQFAHDNVNPTNWIAFIKEQAEIPDEFQPIFQKHYEALLIESKNQNDDCLDQEVMFDVFDTDDCNLEDYEENRRINILLIVAYFSRSKEGKQLLSEWYIENFEG